MSYLSVFADHVALAYHEARNVRHLVKARKIQPAEWQCLISQPTNRDDAWNAMQPLREQARTRQTRKAIARLFENRFHVSLSQLEEMYAHTAWRGSAYGGNAWRDITHLLIQLAEAEDTDVEAFLGKLSVARHNTGTLSDKLKKLDTALAKIGT